MKLALEVLKLRVSATPLGSFKVNEFLDRLGWWNETVYAAFREAGVIFCSCMRTPASA